MLFSVDCYNGITPLHALVAVYQLTNPRDDRDSLRCIIRRICTPSQHEPAPTRCFRKTEKLQTSSRSRSRIFRFIGISGVGTL